MRPDNTLEFVQKIESAGTGGFGHGIDFDGQTLAIGAMYTHRDVLYQGVVHTYLFDGEQWILEQEMTHDDPLEPSLLGISVSIQGDTLLATENATRTGTVEGRIVRFERRPGVGWQEVGDLVAAPPVYARDFGEPVVMRDGKVLAGAPEEIDASGFLTGAAYFFDLTCTDCPPDLDADGALTIYDFLMFANLFDAGDMQADFDGDGELTIFDFLAFQDAFDAGCE
ncbi:MAG: GC-type dockerin domain-anchored protein [Phycisphaerales bacterium JB060]